MRTQTAPRAWRIGAMLGSFLLAACTAAAPSPTASPEPTPSPSPSPDIDVVAAFLEAINAPDWAARGDIEGSLSVGTLTGDVSGEFEQAGADYRNLITITLPGQPPATTEQLLVSGTMYERTSLAGQDGVWMESATGAAGASSPLGALGPSSDLEDAGTEERGGQIVHRLVMADPLDLDPASLGFADPSIEDFQAEFEFFAEDDGTPAALVLLAEWTQDVGGSPSAASFELAYEFASVGGLVRLEAPEEIWELHVNPEFGYSMAHPTEWDVTAVAATEFAAYDLFLNPVAGELQVYHWPGLTPDIIAAAWFRDSAALLEEQYGGPVETNEELTVGGLSARLFGLHGTDASGEFFVQEAVVFGNGVAWDIDWFSDAGNEEADRERFLEFLSTFRVAG